MRPDIAHLEHKVEGLEAQLRRLSSISTLSSNSNDSSSSFDSAPSMSEDVSASRALTHVNSQSSMTSIRSGSQEGQRPGLQHQFSTDFLESLGPIRLSSPAEGGVDTPIYRGTTTGIEILRSLRHFCDSFIARSGGAIQSASEIVDALDTTASVETQWTTSRADFSFSSKSSVRRWMDLAFDQAFTLWPFIDRDALNEYVEQLYGDQGLEGQDYDQDRIGLLHAVIALGQRHDSTLIKAGEKRSRAIETRG